MKIASVVAALAGCTLYLCNVVLGPLNQDEGWYLLAGLNTASGMMPYRDYLFTQGPVLPYVYAALAPLWSPFGVLGGRVVTALMGLAAATFCAGLAWRLAPADRRGLAALLAWLLTTLSPVFSYFTTIPKTYALSGLFIASAFFCLAGHRSWRFEMAGVLLALAAGTRLSLGILLAVVGFGLLGLCRREGFRWAWLRFGLGGGLTLIALIAPFVIFAQDELLFSQGYHSARASSGFLDGLILRAGFVSRLLQGYLTLVFALVIVSVASSRVMMRRLHPLTGFVGLGFIAVLVVHLTAPFPYDDYQTPAMPLATAFVATLCASVFSGGSACQMRVMGRVSVIGALLFTASSPLCMDWVVIRKDRLWFQMKQEPDVLKLRRVGLWLREHTATAGGTLLTQDAYLAVETGMQVPSGLEMGPFSLFPDLDDADARRFNVHNVATLERLIMESDAEWAALSGYAFAVSCPTTDRLGDAESVRLHTAVSARYTEVKSVPDFGQGNTVLTLYRRSAATAQ